jgi:LytS/YehU family sensor histidine kinase
MIKTHFEQRHLGDVLKNEKQRAELNFLKAQIHPHFLFNTLNNLYALTLKKSDQAPETVLKLADMLDYMLYQCDAKSVPIEKELALLDNYIALEKLRYGDRLELSFEKEIDDLHCHIAPLILLSVVENAFKHGASGDAADPHIEMKVQLRNKRLFFRVFNTKPEGQVSSDKIQKKGIGTNNVRRQLELVYPDQFTVETNELEDSYETILTIDLTPE